MICILFIFMKQKLTQTNQIRSSLPDTRDRWKKDEASRLAISSRNVIESPFFKSDVYPQPVRLLGSLSFARYFVRYPFIETAIRLATFCVGELRFRVFRLSHASVRSFSIIGRFKVDFLH